MVERLRMGMAVGMSSMRRAVPFSGGLFAGLRRRAANLSASSIHFVHLFFIHSFPSGQPAAVPVKKGSGRDIEDIGHGRPAAPDKSSLSSQGRRPY